MMDIDNTIRRRFEQRRPDVDLDAAWTALQRRRSRGRRSRRLGVVLGSLLLVGAAVAGVLALTDDDGPSRVSTGLSSESPTRSAGTWRTLQPGPLSPRSGASAAWTGTEMVIVGGTDAPPCPPEASCEYVDGRLQDGAAYNPSTDTWRPIAPPPIPFENAPALWTGDVMLVAVQNDLASQQRRAQQRRALLAYDPVEDTWQQRATPPTDGFFFRHAWTGELAVFVTPENSAGHPGDPIELDESKRDWTYDPTNDRWAPLPRDPFGCGFERSIAATQRALVLFVLECESLDSDASLYRVASFDLATQQWSTLPDSEVAGPSDRWIAHGNVIVNPSTEFVDGGEVDPYDRPYPMGGILDLATATWDDLPQPTGPAPAPSAAVGYSGAAGPWVASGGRLFSPSTRTWQTIPAGPHRGLHDATTLNPAVWTGQEIIVWGGTNQRYNGHVATGAAYTPPEP